MKQDLSNSIASLELVETGSFSVNLLLLFLVMGGIIFAVFRILHRYMLPFVSSRRLRKKAAIILLRSEVLAWGLYSLLVLYQLMWANLWLTLALLVVVGISGFYFLRDFLTGLVFRLENRFAVGDRVRVHDHVGQINHLGVQNLQLQTQEEELIYIPYSTIVRKEVAKLQLKGRLISGKLLIHAGKSDSEELKERIRMLVRNCPWAVVNEKVLISEDADRMLTVNVNAVDQESIMRIESFLNSHL